MSPVAAPTTAKTVVFPARKVPAAPVVLLKGPEMYLVQLARQTLLNTFAGKDGQVYRHHLEASRYEKGQLQAYAAPSLFGGVNVIEVTGAEAMTDAFLTDALAYLEWPPSDCMLIVQHGGGNRGKRLLEAMKSKHVPTVECQAPQRDADKVAFVRAECAAWGRRIGSEAVHQLVVALGSQLGDLARACQQLAADVEGTIGPEHVHQYYGGRVEVNAFQVADAALAGDEAVALVRLRHAFHLGVDPVPLIAALAAKVRLVAKVFGQVEPSASLAKQVGAAPWQVEQARRQGRSWTACGLTAALRAVAMADAQVKGAGKDPQYAVERAVAVIARDGRRR